jgi:predicted DNA-binding transcriptional regulator AlpA
MLLKASEVIDKLRISRATFYRLRYSKHFPKPSYMGPRSPRWDELEINYWITTASPNLRKAA